jgi:ABC-type nickel/cobalt efflux system permease component RcnA
MLLIAFFYAIVLSFILGVVHGITPDEHTWPITFSYAVGSGTVKGGAKAGLVFSSGFTLQRALMSEVAYFIFIGFLLNPLFNGIVYIIVGAVMAFAGAYILNKGIYPHWHWLEKKLGLIFKLHSKNSEYQKKELEHTANPACCDENTQYKAVPMKMAFVHGLIAGFGFGAFALILFTSISPTMPSPWLGWVPGFFFGVGTMITQVAIGSGLMVFLTKVKKLTKNGINFVTKYMSGNTLYYGGFMFVLAGFFIILFPATATYGILTSINIPNLDSIDLSFFLVIAIVLIIGVGSYFKGVKKAEKLGLVETPVKSNEKNKKAKNVKRSKQKNTLKKKQSPTPPQ